MSEPVLGLDIGGTKLAVGMVSSDGTVEEMLVEPSHTEQGPQAVIQRLFRMGDEAIQRSTLGAPRAVGISCGGPLDARAGILISPPHLPGWVDIPIVQMTETHFGLPAFLENDATAAALAEFRFGAGAEAESLAYLTVSTGVGGGAVLDSRLHLGAAGNGGEFGHITVRPDGRECSCGRRGCLEAYCSGTQIAKRAAEELAQTSEPSVLREVGIVTAAEVAEAASLGDPVALRIWDETTLLLGQAVTDLTNILEPEVFVLGGGVTRSGRMLLDPVARQVRDTAMAPAAHAARVELAELGDQVGVVGAAAVAEYWLGLGAPTPPPRVRS